MAEPARKSVTVDDLLAQPEHRRCELVAGEIVEKRATSYEHSDAQSGTAAWTRMYFQRGSGGPTGGWWIGTETEVAYESGECYRHDIAGWRRDRVPVKPSGRPVTIAPDWVAEILSPSNWRHDAVVKFDTCFRHRVGHFWSLDPENRILTVYRWHADGWLRVCAVTPRQRARLEPFDAVEFEVAVLFGDDPGPEPAVIVGQARTPSGFGSGT